uniref:Uncharacterized sensor-like histidine kinase ycf26 n=1 Tax=Schimmelmannia schousboei TaxID=173468 RepID=A0A1C9C8T8_9FLOR|nr:hypothetical protein Schim_101 [Schimmelmannia schousboei]AOM64782.1 hypothetical protein Schim_101 [Schimmelmannia schousboei]
MMFKFKKLFVFITKWWSDIELKTRLIVLMTVIVSLIMSSLTFWALTIIQEDSIITDNRFCKDLGILFASNVIDAVESNNEKELASFVETIYLNTSSIRYILFFHLDGSLFFSLPVYSSKIQDVLQLHQNLFQLETQDFLFNTPLVKYSTLFNDNIIDIIIPLTKNGKNLGSLDLGINSNPTLSSSSKLIRNVSVAIFASIWLMVIIGSTFNALIMTEPIKELLLGIKKISSGNFTERINLPFDGDLGDLIVSFNNMAEKLEFYEKKNLDKLKSEKNKLETIVSTIADGALLIDTELRLLFVNQIALKAFNWNNLDIIGKSICNLFPLHVNDALLPILNNLVKSNCLDDFKHQTEELCIEFDYDSNKVFRFLLTAVLDRNSHILTGVAIIVQDISREMKLNEAKNQFIGNVSHELRTPLCNIGSFLETLLDYNSSLSEQQKKQFLMIANHETKRLSTLVNDILDLSRLESELQYSLSDVDLVKVLNFVVKTFQLIAGNNDISIILELEPRINTVFAHESSLLQVISNLLSNAVKFTSPQGQIVLRVYLLNVIPLNIKSRYLNYKFINVVRIEIIDEGIGIDQRDQKNIFDRFVRIEDNVHTLQGTGLGLSIVKNILRKHNTRILVQSEISVGTSLWFDLLQIKKN